MLAVVDEGTARSSVRFDGGVDCVATADTLGEGMALLARPDLSELVCGWGRSLLGRKMVDCSSDKLRTRKTKRHKHACTYVFNRFILVDERSD